jgi:peptidoglycan/xylan/chitin deacetylase (PgdA/CDA1 family)
MLTVTSSSICQKKVAITIDDIPNIWKYQYNNFETKFLTRLDSLDIPVAIFINEGFIYSNQYVSENFDLLNQWCNREYTTLGNHTFSHTRYSEVGINKFTVDISKGENIIRELSKLYSKELKYFRFPYNDLGKDSLQQTQIKKILEQRKYIITPFTIESSDYMFNYIYQHHLKSGNVKEAELVAKEYIDKTLEYFMYFDSISVQQYNRNIPQIFLCHDNYINADYFHIIIKKLIEKGYSFIRLDEALKDSVYNQQVHYHEKWGISWMYRWMNNTEKRKQFMKHEPDMTQTYKTYQDLMAD